MQKWQPKLGIAILSKILEFLRLNITLHKYASAMVRPVVRTLVVGQPVCYNLALNTLLTALSHLDADSENEEVSEQNFVNTGSRRAERLMCAEGKRLVIAGATASGNVLPSSKHSILTGQVGHPSPHPDRKLWEVTLTRMPQPTARRKLAIRIHHLQDPTYRYETSS